MDLQISVILPTYNRLGRLPRALDSVCSQTDRRWELIVVDDGSTDGTQEWLKKFQKKCDEKEIPLQILCTPNQGVSAARNSGVAVSRGAWLAFLDSDDEWLPEKLEQQVAFALEQPNIPLVHSEEIWVREGRRVNPCKHHRKEGGDIFARSLELCLISPSAAMIKKSLFTALGGFNEAFPVCEDYDLWLRVCKDHPVGFIDKPLIIKYGGHADQLSRKYVAMDYWRVKCLEQLLDQGGLSAAQTQAVKRVLDKKTKILLKGYEKHQNMHNYPEISQIRSTWLRD